MFPQSKDKIPTSKVWVARYLKMDRCLSHPNKRFSPRQLEEKLGLDEPVKKSTVYKTKQYMIDLWHVDLDTTTRNERNEITWHYTDPSFTIKAFTLANKELREMMDQIDLLSCFSGIPLFDEIDAIKDRLSRKLNCSYDSLEYVGFQHNPYVEGLQHFHQLLEAIRLKKALVMVYQDFQHKNRETLIIHPWYLKLHNNRWYILGQCQNLDGTLFTRVDNRPLDRIVKLSQSRMPYIENKTIDFNHYFDHLVGVTYKPHLPIETIVLKVSRAVWPYIKSKPLHPTQRDNAEEVGETDDVILTLQVQINRELISKILSYMDQVEVIGSKNCRELIKVVVDKMYQHMN